MIKSIVCQPRAGGKTTAMVKLVKENNGILITFSETEANRIREQYDLDHDQVRCAKTANLYGLNRPVYVDNIELVLSSLIPGSTGVKGISFTFPDSQMS